MRKPWLLLVLALVATAAVAGVGRRAADPPAPHLPGTCDKGVVLFCADPAWPDPR